MARGDRGKGKGKGERGKAVQVQHICHGGLLFVVQENYPIMYVYYQFNGVVDTGGGESGEGAYTMKV